MRTKLMSGVVLLAQLGGDLRSQIGEFLKIMMLFGFAFGVAVIIGGAMAIRRGDNDGGKLSLISGALIAAAPAIMYALFKITGMETATPLFK